MTPGTLFILWLFYAGNPDPHLAQGLEVGSFLNKADCQHSGQWELNPTKPILHPSSFQCRPQSVTPSNPGNGFLLIVLLSDNTDSLQGIYRTQAECLYNGQDRMQHASGATRPVSFICPQQQPRQPVGTYIRPIVGQRGLTAPPGHEKEYESYPERPLDPTLIEPRPEN